MYTKAFFDVMKIGGGYVEDCNVLYVKVKWLLLKIVVVESVGIDGEVIVLMFVYLTAFEGVFITFR